MEGVGCDWSGDDMGRKKMRINGGDVIGGRGEREKETLNESGERRCDGGIEREFNEKRT